MESLLSDVLSSSVPAPEAVTGTVDILIDLCEALCGNRCDELELVDTLLDLRGDLLGDLCGDLWGDLHVDNTGESGCGLDSDKRRGLLLGVFVGL